MSIHEALVSASRIAASRRQAAELAGRQEEQRLWIRVKAYRDFLVSTGQAYLFEDYLDGIAPSLRPQMSTVIEARPDSTSRRVMTLLLKTFDETPEKQPASTLIHQVNAVHHKRLERHTLHHVASALAEWEEKKRATARDSAEAEEENG